MAHSMAQKWARKKIAVQGHSLAAWPHDQVADILSEEPVMMVTQFADAELLNAPLIQRVLELERDPAFSHRMKIGGSKVRNVADWGLPEAELLNERAKAFFSMVADVKFPLVDLSWASISRKYEYLSPHSHLNAEASVVYCLDAGDENPEYPLNGRLSFADPRLPGCCDKEPGRVTMEVAPPMQAGSMVIFPSDLVHFVHPYYGIRPRITIAWNIR